MALGIHPDLKVGSNVLVLARQRIIDDINGKTGPKMLQLLAQQGATVVMSPGDKKIADFKVVPMQDSGHIKNGEMREYYHKIAKLAPEAAFIFHSRQRSPAEQYQGALSVKKAAFAMFLPTAMSSESAAV